MDRKQRAMQFVGIGRDTATDVAENHDEYLAQAIEADLHGSRTRTPRSEDSASAHPVRSAARNNQRVQSAKRAQARVPESPD
jgi:hypothetical protein